MTPAETQAIMERYREQNQITDLRVSQIRADIWNSQRTDKRQKIWKPADFMSDRKGLVRQPREDSSVSLNRRLEQYQAMRDHMKGSHQA